MRIDVIEKKTEFKNIKTGECFMNTLRNEVYMKRSACGEDNANAVSLKDGELWDFDDDEEVIPVNAKVVIE